MSRTSRFMSKSDRQHDDPPTTARFMPAVVDTTRCVNHGAIEGVPCFRHWPLNDGLPMIEGICNRRAARAGYDAPINPMSLRTRPYSPRRTDGE